MLSECEGSEVLQDTISCVPEVMKRLQEEEKKAVNSLSTALVAYENFKQLPAYTFPSNVRLLKRFLGQGSFGSTFRLRDPETGKMAVVKTAHGREQDNLGDLLLLKHEADVLLTLEHSNIMKCFGVCPPMLGVFLEYCDGTVEHLLYSKEPLWVNLKSKLMNEWGMRLELLKSMTSAAAFLQSKSIVSNDFRRDNWFLKQQDGRWIVKLGDFGHAARLLQGIRVHNAIEW